jgi:hypothetical protein
MNDILYTDRIKGYSLDELESIKATLNREAFPERYQAVLDEIKTRRDITFAQEIQGYSLESLLEAKDSIHQEQHPERFQQLVVELADRHAAGEMPQVGALPFGITARIYWSYWWRFSLMAIGVVIVIALLRYLLQKVGLTPKASLLTTYLIYIVTINAVAIFALSRVLGKHYKTFRLVLMKNRDLQQENKPSASDSAPRTAPDTESL